MKINKKIFHVLPLMAIAGITFAAFTGVSVKQYDKPASAAGDTSISMSIVGDLVFDIVPEVGGVYEERTLNVAVQTNSASGYTLKMSSKDNSTATASNRVGGISSIDNFYTIADMPLNTWGYYLPGATVLSPIPTADAPAPITVTNVPTDDTNRTTSITFGVKVAPNIKSGDYGSTITFTAVSNQDCVGIFCLNTMQDMTSEACTETTTPAPTATLVDNTGLHAGNPAYIPRVTLTDTRDNKTYLVSKLADGKCWMSQNLALDLETSGPLSSENTDLAESDTPVPMRYKTVGKPDENNLYLRDGINPASTPTLTDGSKAWESTGYYYDWYTATAGSGIVKPGVWESGTNGTQSICAKNWRLPQIGEFNNLQDTYVIPIYNDANYLYDQHLIDTYFDDKIGFIGSNAMYKADSSSVPPTYALSGGFGTEGRYWTNSIVNNYYGTILQGVAEPEEVYERESVYTDMVSIRCIAR